MLFSVRKSGKIGFAVEKYGFDEFSVRKHVRRRKSAGKFQNRNAFFYYDFLLELHFAHKEQIAVACDIRGVHNVFCGRYIIIPVR